MKLAYTQRTGAATRRMPMTEPQPDQSAMEPPEWAVDQARGDLPVGADPLEVTTLASDIAEAAPERFNERHDEYDDPDQGGEA